MAKTFDFLLKLLLKTCLLFRFSEDAFNTGSSPSTWSVDAAGRVGASLIPLTSDTTDVIDGSRISD